MRFRHAWEWEDDEAEKLRAERALAAGERFDEKLTHDEIMQASADAVVKNSLRAIVRRLQPAERRAEYEHERRNYAAGVTGENHEFEPVEEVADLGRTEEAVEPGAAEAFECGTAGPHCVDGNHQDAEIGGL